MIIKEMKDTLPQIGQVSWIGIRPAKKAELQEMKAVLVDIDTGLKGDHFKSKRKKRQVTLIQQEHLEVMSSILNKPIHPSEARRNIVVKGINLLALINQEFQIGEVILKGTGPCHPCSRMEENFGPGGYNAMRGHGGITAEVIQGGNIKTNNSVQLIVSNL